MSIALPILAKNDGFIAELLLEQQSLTAVERFSNVHSLNGSAGGHVQSHYYRDLLPSSPPRPGFQFAFEVDLDKCSGCKACVVACHTMNGLEDDEVWRRVGTTVSAGPLGRIQHVTTACHHCEEPSCLLGCPVKAYDKDPVTGIVRHLDDQCIGCKYCTMMCPYEVPQYSKRLGIVRKCDMCHQRLSAGEAPACVQGCPNEAISIQEVAVGVAVISGNDRLAPDAPPSQFTTPTTVYKTRFQSNFDASRPQDQGVDYVSESHWPLAAMLVGTQASVGLLIAERIVATFTVAIGVSTSDDITRWSALVALCLAMVGMNLAPLHLGQPLRAWRVFLGLRTSWLSREAVILGKYVGLLSLAVGLLWFPVVDQYSPEFVIDFVAALPPWSSKAVLGVAIIAGAAGLFSSAMIYIATKRRLWRMTRTMPRFLGSSVVIGIACLLPMLVVDRVPLSFIVVIGLTFVVALGLKVTWELKWHRLLACVSAITGWKPMRHISDLDRRSQRLTQGPMRTVFNARYVFAVSAIAVHFLSFASVALGWNALAAGLAVIAAALVIAGEFAERVLYFTTVVHDRMPGTLR